MMYCSERQTAAPLGCFHGHGPDLSCSLSSQPVIFIITPKQQTVDKIIQYNTTQYSHHESRKELIYTVINPIKI